MKPKDPIRFQRYLVRYSPIDTGDSRGVIEQDIVFETDRINLAPMPNPALTIVDWELSDSGRSLCKLAAERRSKETVFTVVFFIGAASLVLIYSLI